MFWLHMKHDVTCVIYSAVYWAEIASVRLSKLPQSGGDLTQASQFSHSEILGHLPSFQKGTGEGLG